MKRFVQLSIILLLAAAGVSACGAVSASFTHSGDTTGGILDARPSRTIYSVKTTFNKITDVSVYLYSSGGGFTKVPNANVVTTVGDLGVLDSYTFAAKDAGTTWEVLVAYLDLEPTRYTIHVLSAEEEAYYDSGGSGSSGVDIIITGPGAP